MLDILIYIPTVLAYTFVIVLIVILGFIVVYISYNIYIAVYDSLPVPSFNTIPQIAEDSSEYIERRKSHLNTTWSEKESNRKTALRIIITTEPSYLAYVKFKLVPLPPFLKKHLEHQHILATGQLKHKHDDSQQHKWQYSDNATEADINEENFELKSNLENLNFLSDIEHHLTNRSSASVSPENEPNRLIQKPKIIGKSPRHSVDRADISYYERITKYYDRLTMIPTGRVMRQCAQESNHHHDDTDVNEASSTDGLLQDAIKSLTGQNSQYKPESSLTFPRPDSGQISIIRISSQSNNSNLSKTQSEKRIQIKTKSDEDEEETDLDTENKSKTNQTE